MDSLYAYRLRNEDTFNFVIANDMENAIDKINKFYEEAGYYTSAPIVSIEEKERITFIQ